MPRRYEEPSVPSLYHMLSPPGGTPLKILAYGMPHMSWKWPGFPGHRLHADRLEDLSKELAALLIEGKPLLCIDLCLSEQLIGIIRIGLIQR